MLTRKRLRYGLVVAAVASVALLGVVPTSPASAQDGDAECGLTLEPGPNGEDKVVWTCSADWQGGSGGERVCQVDFGNQQWGVPCFHDVYGWFSTVQGGCYIKPASPQPPAGAESWRDHDRSEGVVYTAYCFALDGVEDQLAFQQPADIFLETAETPILDLLEQAIALLTMEGPDIQIAPDPSGVGLVGLPVWMWTPPTESTWGPQRKTLEALDHVVMVTANAEQITWDMGDGTERVCTGPGTPYVSESGADPSPDCGHAYALPSRDLPEGRYTVTATTEWQIDWQVEDSSVTGTEFRTRQESVSIRINELQVVTS